MKLSRVLPALAVVLAVGCNNVPVEGLQNSFSLVVTNEFDNKEPVKVDFLWVIDNSASMCQEQASLAASFDDFLSKIVSFVNIDYRIAVVTTDVISPDHFGKFRHHKTTEFPFACVQTQIEKCVRGTVGDKVCEAYGNGWVCDAPEKTKNITNCNGTFNSKCRKLCTEDWECEQAFEDEAAAKECKDNGNCRYKCLVPSGDPSNSGCVLRPETGGCPNDQELYDILVAGSGQDSQTGRCDNGALCVINQVGCQDGSPCKPSAIPYLTPKTADDYFKCVGVVGAEQHNNANLEQGLNAAIFALAKDGPNAEQAKAFLRDDAYLVLVFVSDEDDCSVDDYRTLKKEQYGTCTCQADSSNGGALRPVGDAVNRIKSLKKDPGSVLVAAIVGDSQASALDGVLTERDDYFKSKCTSCDNPQDEHPLLFNTYICQSKDGKADYGRRYVEFVDRFGKNGIVENICAPEGLGPALDTIADRIIRVFAKVCLPRDLLDEETMVVEKFGPGGTCEDGSPCCTVASQSCSDSTTCPNQGICNPTAEIVLPGTEEGSTTYHLASAADCEDTADNTAVFFNFLLKPGTSVRIDYQAVPPGAETTRSR